MEESPRHHRLAGPQLSPLVKKNRLLSSNDSCRASNVHFECHARSNAMASHGVAWQMPLETAGKWDSSSCGQLPGLLSHSIRTRFEARDLGVRLSLFTTSSLLSAMEMCRQWRRALTFSSWMSSEDLVDLVSSCSAISACAFGAWAAALARLPRASVVARNAVLSGLERAKRWERPESSDLRWFWLPSRPREPGFRSISVPFGSVWSPVALRGLWCS